MLDYAKLNLPAKQQDILRTALDLFQRFGIKRVTVEEICQTAGVSKMTFYKYFKNKNELVRFMWGNAFEQAMEKFEQIRRMDVPIEEKLHLLLKLKDESTARISHQFALEYFHASPDLKDFFEQLAENSINQFLDFIQEAQQIGEVRRDLKPEFLLAVINHIKILVQDETLVNSYNSYHDFVMEVNRFIFYGLLPRPDNKEQS